MDDEQTDVLELDTELEQLEPTEADDGEIVIEIEGVEPDPEPETPLIKKMRNDLREAQREAAELKRRQAAQPVEVGPKPTLESCDWDEDRHEAELLAWNDRKRTMEQAEQARLRKEQDEAAQFEKARVAYRTKAATLGIPNIDDAEAKVTEALGPDYVGLIIANANEPAKLIAALGAHPSLLQKVEAETNPVRRIMLLATMETNVKIGRKAAPAPEAGTIVRGSAPIAANTDKEAERLFKKAQQSGDYSDFYAYQRQLRKK